MATVRRVQPLSEMGIFCVFLCMSVVLQCVSSQGGENGPPAFKPGPFNVRNIENAREVLQEHKSIDGQPQLFQGNNRMGMMPGKKTNPNLIPGENRDQRFGVGEVRPPSRNNQLGLGQSARQQFPNVGGPVAPNAPKIPVRGPSLGRKMPQIKIAEHPMCSADAKQLCSSSSLSNNFAVLDCLQSDFKNDVSNQCQHFLWEYKKNLTTDLRFDAAASEVCKDAMEELPECKKFEAGHGHRISCLIEYKNNISNASCKQFLTKMASIVFSDYRLVFKFAKACEQDILKLSCGRLDNGGLRNVPHSQGHTIACLSEHIRDLDSTCKHEIVRIAELQADDYHMDRPLFYACREDRERFCQRAKAGGGKVYKCLYRHKFDRDMSSDCREKLVVRQSLARESFKVNKAFSDACRHDIKQHECAPKEKAEFRQAKLSTVLLCLEGKQKEGLDVSPECVGELKEIRRSLMEDYKISPQIVVSCATEIARKCDGGLHREGKTLHCLMDLIRQRKRKHRDRGDPVASECRTALETLLREADAGEDYSMDPALQKACQPVVDTACKHVKAGDARVMNCLMEKVGTNQMNDECQERLMEIQYFIARDFKLDSRLYKFCHRDAAKFCNADESWNFQGGPSKHPIIFSCLYRQQKLFSDKSVEQLNRACAFEVKRIMRQRSISVELEPRIEEPCLANLGEFCSEQTGKGAEMACLREKYKELDKPCQWAVANFTEDLDKDPTIDRILMRACTEMIKNFCSDLVDKDDAEPSEIMECLIKHKHSAQMNRKCAAGIEHHQLVTMQDFRFSFKFKEACKNDVMQHCGGVHKKSEVVICLSAIHRNDTLFENSERLSRACRKQLRFELFQRSESINLDPVLKKECEMDSKRFCDNITPGNAMVIECLKKHRSDISPECRAKLFKRERYEALDNSVDFVLMTSCKSMIKHYCSDTQVTEVYACLLRHKSDMDFDPKCRRVVKERQLTHHTDYRLNPQLSKSCRLDIPKFCKAELPSDKEETHMIEGRVLNCLKVKFVARRLSRDCEDHIRGFIQEAALNYKDDPVLAKNCREEIKSFCLDPQTGSDDDDGKGKKKKVPTATLR